MSAMTFVLDSSVALTWVFADEETDYSRRVRHQQRRDGAVAPAIWPLEVANAVLVGERRQRLTRAEAERFITALSAQSVEVDIASLTDRLEVTLGLAREHQLSVYDATYLELALRLGLPLATLDARLRDAATRVGVQLLA
jgi:predicted nucleic acid-binding protein